MKRPNRYNFIELVRDTERSQRLNVTVHDRVRNDVTKASGDRGAHSGWPRYFRATDPAPHVGLSSQKSQHGRHWGTDRKDDDRRQKRSAKEGVKEAVDRPVTSNKMVRGLEVDRDLGTAEQRKRKMATCRCLQSKANAAVKECDWQLGLLSPALAPRAC